MLGRLAVAIYVYIFIIYHWIEQKSNERASHLSLQSVGLFHFPIFNELRICRLRINMFLLYFTWILTRHGLDLNYEYINEDCNNTLQIKDCYVEHRVLVSTSMEYDNLTFALLCRCTSEVEVGHACFVRVSRDSIS